ncbi:hypothetical protein HID58_091173 [Brassica napus]|uniref:Uncharacterized protein n=1 Tax=Brassica napus TaxID=3708 RepID=A0ABQ7X4A9_BRANA|nr:hypothetical protein HID58_091173 [Brassica napus]
MDACEAVWTRSRGHEMKLGMNIATHTEFVELKYMNRHKLKGILRTKQKVFIRCIMCGDMRRVAKVVVVGSGVVAKCVFGRCVGGDCVVVRRAVVRQVVKW